MIKTIISKILIVLLIISAVSAGAFIIYLEVTKQKQIDAINKTLVQQQELMGDINRAQSELATKDDISNFAESRNVDLKTIQSNMDTLHAQIEGINGLNSTSIAQHVTDVPSTSVTPGVDVPALSPNQPDPYGYLTNKQNLALNETFSNVQVPFGTISFSAWKDKPWDINVDPRKYQITSVLGEDSDGRHYTYSKFSIIQDGKSYDIKIDDNEFLEEVPQAKFTWLNARAYLGVSGGINFSSPIRGKFTPNVGVAFSSWGKTTSSPTFTFAEVSGGPTFVDGKPVAAEFMLTPVQFNLGKAGIPLIDNTFIGPNVSVSTLGNVGAGIGINVGL